MKCGAYYRAPNAEKNAANVAADLIAPLEELSTFSSLVLHYKSEGVSHRGEVHYKFRLCTSSRDRCVCPPVLLSHQHTLQFRVRCQLTPDDNDFKSIYELLMRILEQIYQNRIDIMYLYSICTVRVQVFGEPVFPLLIFSDNQSDLIITENLSSRIVIR